MDDFSRRRRPRRYKGTSSQRDYAVFSGFESSAIAMTYEGPLPLEWLSEGDKVLTLGGGFQPVVWIERTKLEVSELHDLPEVAPVLIEPGALGDDAPDRPMIVSPSQLLFVARNPLQPSRGGVLVPANVVGQPVDLARLPDHERITYVSLLMPSHQIIQLDCAWMGSLFIADLAAGLEPEDPLRTSLSSDVMEPAAPILTQDEAVQFMAERARAGISKSA